MPCEVVSYDDFRCGTNFAQVAAELAQEAHMQYDALGQYKPVTRNRVLGRLHEYKMAAYQYYLKCLEEPSDYDDSMFVT